MGIGAGGMVARDQPYTSDGSRPITPDLRPVMGWSQALTPRQRMREDASADHKSPTKTGGHVPITWSKANLLTEFAVPLSLTRDCGNYLAPPTERRSLPMGQNPISGWDEGGRRADTKALAWIGNYVTRPIEPINNSQRLGARRRALD